MANCSAVISNQTTGTTVYSNTALTNGMFHGYNDNYFIFDNLSIDGYNDGAGGTHTKNTRGIYGAASNNFTINNNKIYNNDDGIDLETTNYTLINNTQLFNGNY